MIGGIYIEHAIAPWSIKYVLRPLMLPNKNTTITDPSLFISMTSSVYRIVVVPLFLLICLVTFGSDSTMFQAICGLFMVADPVVGVVTIIIVRYWAKHEEEKEHMATTVDAENESL